MYEPHVEKILSMLRPDDVVLDIGGWACPFNRANFVMDAFPFETRGAYREMFSGKPYQGPEREHFTKQNWIVRDICDRMPYPFRDKEIDFVICSHVLEDIRDPLWVVSEMRRIAKRGYIEMPSREAETCRGWEHPRLAGLSHHRWLIEIDAERRHVTFLMKYHMIHSHWRFSLPASHLASLPEERMVQWLFWDDSVTAEERILHGESEFAKELAAYVQRIRPYAGWRLQLDRAADRAWRVGRWAASRARRNVGRLIGRRPALRPR